MNVEMSHFIWNKLACSLEGTGIGCRGSVVTMNIDSKSSSQRKLLDFGETGLDFAGSSNLGSLLYRGVLLKF